MKGAFLAAWLLFSGTAARAELLLERVDWELAVAPKGKAVVFEPLDALRMVEQSLKGKLRAQLTLKNRGPKPVEAVLLRYAMSARLATLDSSAEGIWAVPFIVEERRVPRVGPNQLLKVPLGPSPMFALYLRKIKRSGFCPDRFKIQVMIEPHYGEVPALQVLEKILPVER